MDFRILWPGCCNAGGGKRTAGSSALTSSSARGSSASNFANLPAAYGWDVTTHIDTVLARISYKFDSVPLAAKY
jgi:hypothetical protein